MRSLTSVLRGVFSAGLKTIVHPTAFEERALGSPSKKQETKGDLPVLERPTMPLSRGQNSRLRILNKKYSLTFQAHIMIGSRMHIVSL